MNTTTLASTVSASCIYPSINTMALKESRRSNIDLLLSLPPPCFVASNCLRICNKDNATMHNGSWRSDVFPLYTKHNALKRQNCSHERLTPRRLPLSVALAPYPPVLVLLVTPKPRGNQPRRVLRLARCRHLYHLSSQVKHLTSPFGLWARRRGFPLPTASHTHHARAR